MSAHPVCIESLQIVAAIKSFSEEENLNEASVALANTVLGVILSSRSKDISKQGFIAFVELLWDLSREETFHIYPEKLEDLLDLAGERTTNNVH